jgi:hypothetical protein
MMRSTALNFKRARGRVALARTLSLRAARCPAMTGF